MDNVPEVSDYGETERQDESSTQPQRSSRKFDKANVWATRPITSLETRRRYLRHEGVRQEVVNTYAGLLREMVDEVLLVPAKPKDKKKGKRRYGAVVWTSAERDAFFRLLSRKGRSRIDEIAEAIPSKSVLEIQDYARMLHESLRRRQRNLLEAEKISRLGRFKKHRIEEAEDLLDVSYADLPAAVEVSRDLELALDHFAESLLLTERHNLDKEGMKEHGKEFWNIDRATAEKIEAWLSKADVDENHDDESEDSEEDMNADSSQASESSDSDAGEVGVDQSSEQSDQVEIANTQSSIFLTAKLLKITEWIEMSERIFMNSGGSRTEDNWRNLRLKDESPGLTADAFAEFYEITVNLTRRIVRAIVMRKMSQLSEFYYGEIGQSAGVQKPGKSGASGHESDGGNDDDRENPGYFITPGDVLATVTALGLNRDSNYYVGLARRFELDVIDERVNARPKNRVMDYDEVEALLSGRSNLPPARNTRPGPKPRDNADEADEADETTSLRERESQVAGDNTDLDDDDDPSDPGYVEEDDDDDEDYEDEEVDDADDSDLSLSVSDQLSNDSHSAENEDDSVGNRLDAYLNYVDKKASRKEEAQLRQSLSCPLIDALPALQSPQEEDTARPPPLRPPLPTKTFDDLYDWRDQTPYMSPWELGRKRRRSEAELSEQDDD